MSYSGRAEDPLFNKVGMHAALEGQKRALAKAVEDLPPKRMLGEDMGVLTSELVNKFKIDVPQLQESDITVSPAREINVDVSRDFRRAVYGDGPHYVKGTSVTFTVPFVGDEELFRVQPNRYDGFPPRGTVGRKVLQVTFSGIDLNAEELKRKFAEFLESTKKYLTWQAESITPFNNDLPRVATDFLVARKARLSQADQLIGSLGYKVK